MEPIQTPPTPQTRYNPAEAERLVEALCTSPLEPEYILLFGSLAGGTPHSDVTAYDLLIAVRRASSYDWALARRYLRNKLPPARREVPYMNIYVLTLEELELLRVPYLHFARTEGELLYCKERYDFRRPHKPHNFRAACSDAALYRDMFLPLGKRFLEQAQEALGILGDDGIRMAAHAATQAAIQFYRVLYYVYHNQEFESCDPQLMHERMRTLSTELKLLYEDTHIDHVTTLPRLKMYGEKACSDPKFAVNGCVLEQDVERVQRMEEIVERVTEERLKLYDELAAK